jgi:fructokinase
VTIWGAIELGGSKATAVVGNEPADLSKAIKVATTTPEETLSGLLEVFEGANLAGVGIASFGPIDLDTRSSSYGHITSTPKPGWSWTDVVGPIERATSSQVAIETDVNAAAMAEARWGSAIGFEQVAYVTIGTGIGGGLSLGGLPIHGSPHPEMGHTVVRVHPEDTFEGVCPFHGICVEGMASGPAIESRFGANPENLSESTLTEVRDLVAFYVAQGLRNLIYVAAPDRIVVGGGLSHIEGLLEALRNQVADELAGYPGIPVLDFDEYLVPPGLGDHSGLAGALVMAMTIGA